MFSKTFISLFILICLIEVSILVGFFVYKHNLASKQALIIESAKETTIPAMTPQPQVVGDFILFVSDATGNKDIYLMNLETKKPINLTNNPSDDMNPQVSPDGKYIVFYSNRTGNNQIFRMDLTTKEVVQLTHNSSDDFDPSYSPDGQKIAFKSTRDDKNGDIFIMTSEGLQQQNLTPTRKTTEEWDPTFSQDGQKIIFVVRRGTNDLTDEIYMMNTDGSNIIPLTKNKVVDWYPSVNLQNGNILYISREPKVTTDDIFVMNQTGTGNSRITNLPGNDADPAWDKTGKKIIFINDNEKNYDLYEMNFDGSNVTKVLSTPSDELSPIFLPTPVDTLR